jgi:hypothetical protein
MCLIKASYLFPNFSTVQGRQLINSTSFITLLMVAYAKGKEEKDWIIIMYNSFVAEMK